jgi:hypothetical protein
MLLYNFLITGFDPALSFSWTYSVPQAKSSPMTSSISTTPVTSL